MPTHNSSSYSYNDDPPLDKFLTSFVYIFFLVFRNDMRSVRNGNLGLSKRYCQIIRTSLESYSERVVAQVFKTGAVGRLLLDVE